MGVDRRGVLAGLVGAGLAAPVWAKERRQARIAKVEAFAVPGAVFVKVSAEDGASGWGEAGHSGGAYVAALINAEAGKLLKGADVFAAEPAWARLFYEWDELGPGGVASQALAGIDCALWDLRGRLLDQPVYNLLGGAHRLRFPVYGSFSRDNGDGTYKSPEACAAQAQELAAEGFKTLKVRLAIREENADPDPDPALPVLRAVRKAVGDAVTLYVDANNGYRPAQAIRIGKALAAECGVTVLEEPVAAYHYPSLAQVAGALDLDIAAGEHEYTRWAFRDLILQGRPDVLNPDVSKLAGLSEARKVAALAEAFDLPIAVHNARPTLLSAAHAHFVASASTATRPQEHPGRERLAQLWRYFDRRLSAEGGFFSVPEGPGLGLNVDEAAVRKAVRT